MTESSQTHPMRLFQYVRHYKNKMSANTTRLTEVTFFAACAIIQTWIWLPHQLERNFYNVLKSQTDPTTTTAGD